MSLVEQLKKLQIPGQNQPSSKKVSILFDTHTASGLDNESILNIGISGFEELESIDPVFTQFQYFFCKDALTFQRLMINKEKNNQVKKNIMSYLLLLSPYIMLKAAHKTLEWLIRRYEIHIHDKDALMMCILPYHETKIFARIIQVFGKNQRDDIWYWMASAQKEGVGFSIQSLIKQCKDSRNLLQFIFKMAEEANDKLDMNPKSGLKHIFSFLGKTVTILIESFEVLNEKFISYLLPLLNTGLKSNNKDFVVSIYMIVGMMCSKIQLSNDVLKAFMVTLIKSMQPLWYEEGLLCLIALIIHQNVKSFSPRVFNKILKLDIECLMNVLVSLHAQLEVDHFIHLLITPICDNYNHNKKCVDMFNILMNEIQLGKKQTNIIVRKMIEESLKYSDNDDEDTSKEDYGPILKKLSKRFAVEFDEAVSSLYRKFEEHNNLEQQERLSRLLSTCLSTTKHEVIVESNMPLMISLNHPESTIRRLAVSKLFEVMNDDIAMIDREFYRTSILARLRDDVTEVVNEVLKYSKTFVTLLSQEELCDIIKYLMGRTNANYCIDEILLNVIENIESLSDEANEFTYILLLQCIQSLSGKNHHTTFDIIRKSSNKLNHPILNALQHVFNTMKTVPSKKQDIVILYNNIITKVAESITEDGNKKEILKSFCGYVSKLPLEHDLQIIYLQILENMDGNLLKEIDLSTYLHLNSVELNSDEEKSLRKPKKNKNYVMVEHLRSMKDFTDKKSLLKLCFIRFLQRQCDCASQRKDEEMMMALFSTISTQINKSNKFYEMLFQEFFRKCFSDKEESTLFLTSFCVAMSGKEDKSSCKNLLTSLQILSQFLEDCGDFSKDSFNTVVPSLIALLNNPMSSIRKVSLTNINLISSATKKKKSFLWNPVMEFIGNKAQEISLDEDHIKRVLQEFFVTTTEADAKNAFAAFSTSKSNKASIKLNCLKQYIDVATGLLSFKLQKILFQLLDYVSFKDIWNEVVTFLNNNIEQVSEEKVETFLVILEHLSKDECSVKYHDEVVKIYLQCIASLNEQIQSKSIALIDSLFFENLLEERQLEILIEVTKILLNSNKVIKSTQIRTTLKRIKWNGKHISHFLQDFVHGFDRELRDASFLEKVDEKWENLRVVTEILEAANFSDGLKHADQVVLDLFSAFERILKLPSQSFEYHRQLCLSTFVSLLDKSNSKTISGDNFKTDLVVTCLQTSSDVSTNQLCLQVLGSAVTLCPVQVLHNVMHIFTFMGNNLLKVDNEHTFHIIEKTIDSIVPVLLKDEEESEAKISKKKRKASETKENLILFILQTFIDSLPHCPEHRQLHILTHLIRVMEEKIHLHTAVIVLLRKIVETASNTNNQDEKMDVDVTPITLEFCLNFFMQYPSYLLIDVLKQLFVYLEDLFEHTKSTSQPKKQKKDRVEMQSLGQKNSQIFNSLIIMFTATVIKNKKITSAFEGLDKRQAKLLNKGFLSLIEALMRYTEVIMHHKRSLSVDEKTSKFLEKMNTKLHNIILMLQTILPLNSFLSLINGLVGGGNVLMQKKSLEMFCSKITTLSNIDSTQEALLMKIFHGILPLLRNVTNTESDKEELILCQSSLYTIKVLCNFLHVNHRKEFIDALPQIIQLYNSENDCNSLVAVNAILCVAEIASSLKTYVLPYLPAIVNPLLMRVDSDIKAKEDVKVKELFVSCFVTTMDKLLVAIPHFLSPYVDTILEKVAVCSVSITTDNVNISQSISNLQSTMGKKLPPRVLYRSIEKIFDDTAERDLNQLVPIMQILKSSFTSISKLDANENFNTNIVELLKKVFTLRTKSNKEDIVVIVRIENEIIEAFCLLVMKLSENTLRPIYIELFTWSTKENSGYDQMTAFYRLSLQLSATLKSLYLLFIGPVFKHASNLCTELHSDQITLTHERNDVDHVDLLTSVIDTLDNCFRYDTQGFLTKDKFKLMLEPLTNQLDNKTFGDNYETFVKNHLRKCIVNFASAVNDASCWKLLNQAVLLKTKSSEPKIRFATLEVVYDIYERMGESYMILIPETIPYLAEILEDDSNEVEKQCQKVVKLIEDISGESMQKYF